MLPRLGPRPMPTAARVTIAAIYTQGQTGKAILWTLEGQVLESTHANEHVAKHSSTAVAFCEELKRRAYAGLTPRRRLRVVVNPHGGKGRAKQLWTKAVAPVFAAAGCSVALAYTGPPSSPSNARVLAQEHVVADFDAIVTVSGDGIVHELLNGLASRPDGLTALRATPIVPIPAGSGNALQINLEGPSKANDCVWAALAAIKGKPVALDLCSVVQDGTRFYSFLSQGFGLMADIDLGTEQMRLLGDLRFILGFVQGALTKRTYPVELAIKVAPEGTSKSALARLYNASLSNAPEDTKRSLLEENQPMPELRFGTLSDPLPPEAVARVHTDVPVSLEPGWHILKTRVSFIYAGKLPYVAANAKFFPPATGNDGFVDLAIVGPTSRLDALTGMDGAEHGSVFLNAHTRYYRCEAYRLTPINPKGYIAIDGESVPHLPFQVEVHRGLATVLSLSGKWFGAEIKGI